MPNPLDLLRRAAMANVPRPSPQIPTLEQEENRDFRAQAVQDVDPSPFKRAGRSAIDYLGGLVEDPFSDSPSEAKGLTQQSAGTDAGMLTNVAPLGAGTVMLGGKKIHNLLRNHPVDQLKRMVDQGYDVSNVLYHGTPNRFSTSPMTEWSDTLAHDAPKGFESLKPTVDANAKYGPGVYLSDSAETAGGYGQHGHVYPVVTRGTNSTSEMFSGPTADKLTVPSSYKGKDQIVRDPKNIRSIFAQFDPSKMDSKDLLASILAAVGLNKINNPEGGQ